MGVATLTVNNKIVFSSTCGFADAEWNVKNSEDTRFRIGSITKEFTAAAVLLLHEDGKVVSLTDPIGKYVRDLPESWRPATIHQLLTHTSGVPIYTASRDLKQVERLDTRPTELLKLVWDTPLMYAHGTKLSYNNSGYILLGLLIESVCGVSYERFLQDRIFNPLGMKDSGSDATQLIVAREARGYTRVGGQLQKAGFVDASSAWSAGELYSTVADLTRWSEAMANGKLLGADSTERMYHLYPEATIQGLHYGYGAVLGERFEHKLQYHGGGIGGFNSVLQRYPEVNMVLAVLSNLDSNSDVLASWNLGDSLAKIWFEAQRR